MASGPLLLKQLLHAGTPGWSSPLTFPLEGGVPPSAETAKQAVGALNQILIGETTGLQRKVNTGGHGGAREAGAGATVGGEGIRVQTVHAVFTVVALGSDSRSSAPRTYKAFVDALLDASLSLLLPSLLTLLMTTARAKKVSADSSAARHPSGEEGHPRPEAVVGDAAEAFAAAARHLCGLAVSGSGGNTKVYVVAVTGLGKLVRTWPAALRGGKLNVTRMVQFVCKAYREGQRPIFELLRQRDGEGDKDGTGKGQGRGGADENDRPPMSAEQQGQAAQQLVVQQQQQQQQMKVAKMFNCFALRLAELLGYLGAECAPPQRDEVVSALCASFEQLYPLYVTEPPCAERQGLGWQASLVKDLLFPKHMEAWLTIMGGGSHSGGASGTVLERSPDVSRAEQGWYDPSGFSATLLLRGLQELQAAGRPCTVGAVVMLSAALRRCGQEQVSASSLLQRAETAIPLLEGSVAALHGRWSEWATEKPPSARKAGDGSGGRDGSGWGVISCDRVEYLRRQQEALSLQSDAAQGLAACLGALLRAAATASASTRGAAGGGDTVVEARELIGAVQSYLVSGCTHGHVLCREVWLHALAKLVKRCSDGTQQLLLGPLLSLSASTECSPRARSDISAALARALCWASAPTQAHAVRWMLSSLQTPSSSVQGSVDAHDTVSDRSTVSLLLLSFYPRLLVEGSPELLPAVSGFCCDMFQQLLESSQGGSLTAAVPPTAAGVGGEKKDEASPSQRSSEGRGPPFACFRAAVGMMTACFSPPAEGQQPRLSVPPRGGAGAGPAASNAAALGASAAMPLPLPSALEGLIWRALSAMNDVSLDEGLPPSTVDNHMKNKDGNSSHSLTFSAPASESGGAVLCLLRLLPLLGPPQRLEGVAPVLLQTLARQLDRWDDEAHRTTNSCSSSRVRAGSSSVKDSISRSARVLVAVAEALEVLGCAICEPSPPFTKLLARLFEGCTTATTMPGLSSGCSSAHLAPPASSPPSAAAAAAAAAAASAAPNGSGDDVGGLGHRRIVWPTLTAAQRCVEVLATTAQADVASSLMGLVPPPLLPSLKARLSKRLERTFPSAHPGAGEQGRGRGGHEGQRRRHFITQEELTRGSARLAAECLVSVQRQQQHKRQRR